MTDREDAAASASDPVSEQRYAEFGRWVTAFIAANNWTAAYELVEDIAVHAERTLGLTLDDATPAGYAHWRRIADEVGAPHSG